jgi:hypothetical protein
MSKNQVKWRMIFWMQNQLHKVLSINFSKDSALSSNKTVYLSNQSSRVLLKYNLFDKKNNLF